METSGDSSTSINDEKEIKGSMWHGSVNTSTDTLVPIDTKSQNGSTVITPNSTSDLISSDTTDAGECLTEPKHNTANLSTVNTQKPETEQFIGDKSKSASVSTNCKILPKVHSSLPSNNITRPNQLPTNDGNLIVLTSLLSPTAPLEISNQIPHNLINSSSDNKLSASSSESATTHTDASNMEESIFILPEHQKLEISFSGTCEMIAANVTTSSGPVRTSDQQLNPTSAVSTSDCVKTSDNTTSINMSGNSLESLATATATVTSQRRRRTSSSNSKRDSFGVASKQINNRFVR